MRHDFAKPQVFPFFPIFMNVIGQYFIPKKWFLSNHHGPKKTPNGSMAQFEFQLWPIKNFIAQLEIDRV